MKKIPGIYNNFILSLKQKTFWGKSLDDLLIKFLLALTLIIVIVLMLPSERPFEYENLTIGSVSTDEIIADFTFPIIKPQKVLEEERRLAALSVPPVFTRMSNTLDIQKLKLKNMLNEINVFFTKFDKKDLSNKIKLNDFIPSGQLDSLKKQISLKYNINLSDTDLNNFYQLFKSQRANQFYNFLVQGLTQIYENGVINRDKSTIEEKKITILHNGIEQDHQISEVSDRKEAVSRLLNFFAQKYSEERIEYKLAQKIAPAFIVPDLAYNEELTKPRKEKAIHDVPKTSGFVHKNERIVDSHEIITEDIYWKLQSLAQAQKERSALKQGGYQLLFYAGEYLFAILVTLMLGFFIRYFNPDLFSDNKMLVMITIILLLQFAFSMLIIDVLEWNFLTIPVILAPMLLSMLLNATVAFWSTVVISFVLGASQGNNFYLALLTFFVGTIALLSVQKIRNRGQMFRAILFVLIGYAVLNFSYGFIHYEPFKKILQNFVFYNVPNAILAPTAVFLLIGIFEKFFDITTDITLLELSDLNHPLLKRLSVEAPGTFHHSIIVGNLAEAAAEAIGANALLARVGCYYHDIGKMHKPEYFVENQANAMNKHENLTPSMSCLILVKHVKAGLDLAEQYGLPRAVKQFIPEHHGRSLMTYFYHKAKELANVSELNEDNFRYPGPKPQTKETAIAMLADNVEAAARTLPNPNPQRIVALIDNLIEQRIKDGQLDECDLTLRDLTKIKEAFVPILVGIHHLRVEYPQEDLAEGEKKVLSEKHANSDGKTVDKSGKAVSKTKKASSKEQISRNKKLSSNLIDEKQVHEKKEDPSDQ